MLIEELTLRGILSFAPETPPLQMRPLNVLIGPNGSGKSNLIQAIDLLRASARAFTAPLRTPGGGVHEWIWKAGNNRTASIEAVVRYPDGPKSLRHRIEFSTESGRLEVADESIENCEPFEGHTEPFFFYRYQRGLPVLSVKEGERRQLHRQDIKPDESILSQRNDPDLYPELHYLSERYKEFRIYQEWAFGPRSRLRAPQPSDLPSDALLEDSSNLGLVLNYLRSVPDAKRIVLQRLRNLYEGLDDFDVRIKGGTVEVFLTEGNFIIPANRLSDGTLRYLCLLAILCDPEPPPVICMEEPELGLHPDLIVEVADLLVEASQRTQLVVTTHSDILVSALSENPECVVVFEKLEGKTEMRRLEMPELKEWLGEYGLGDLWIRGELGGTRW